MEEKQLDFSQPLLSVRRISSALTSQKKKTDTISSIPPLPSYKSEMISGPITNAGNVPFVWEQIPGRPKSQTSQQIHATVPRLPPGRTLTNKNQDSGRSNGPRENPFKSQSVVHLSEEKVDSSKEELEERNSDSGDGDEAFMDALDTLSRTESSFYNSSVGGLSDLKPSKTFSIDDKTRDFMMDRFLPAAKAMASEEPPHSPRKQPMVWDTRRHLNKVVNANNQPSLRYGPNYVQEYSHENTEEESDSDDDQDIDENTSFKVCGFLPRFASKGSLCLLNPVPGMSQRTKVPISPVTRTMQASSFSQAGSCNKPEEEPARVAIYKQRPGHGFQAAEQPKDKRVSRNSQKLEGSTLYNRLQGNDSKLPECAVDVANSKGFNGCDPPKKCPNSFKELLTHSMEIESGTEKTLYVDIIHKMGSETKNSNPYVHSSLVNDTKSLSIPCGEATLQSNVQNPMLADESNEATLQTNVQNPMLADESNEDVEIEIIKDFEKGTKNYSVTKVGDNVNRFSKHPPPPPLPKSPSDSWLCRTLPSVPSKNSALRSYLGTRVNPSSSADPKWGNFVTTSEAQQKHSQGAFMPALTPIPET